MVGLRTGEGGRGAELQLLGRKSSGDLFSHICSLYSTAELYTTMVVMLNFMYILLQWRNLKNKLRGTGQAQRVGRV